MLDAYCEEKGRGFFAYEVWREFDEKTLRGFHWYCCPQKHSLVIPYRKHMREGYWVCSHFKTKPDHEGCPVGESDQHLKSKLVVIQLLEEKQLSLTDNLGLAVNFNDTEFLDVPKIEFRWETPRHRRSDVCLPFKVFHPYLGRGIAFEVELSGHEDKERTQDWLMNGFSVSWLFGDSFSEENAIRTPIIVQYPYITVLQNLSGILGDLTKRLNKVEEWNKRIWHGLKELMSHNKTCFFCYHSSKDLYEKGIVCWKHRKGNRPTKPNFWDTCEHWKPDYRKLKNFWD